jgi:hypothetical protein
MTTFNENLNIGHGATFSEHATNYRINLNGVSMSTESNRVVFSYGDKKKTLVLGPETTVEGTPIYADANGNVTLPANLYLQPTAKIVIAGVEMSVNSDGRLMIGDYELWVQ